MENNELQHWGIKGMQWGRRRYQNTDGSLTPAGKKRYNDDSDNDDTPAYQKQYDAARKAIAAERAAERRAKADSNHEPEQENITQEQVKRKRKSTAKKVAIGLGIAALAGSTLYGISEYRQRIAFGKNLADKMLDNMKEFTVDDFNSKSKKGRRIFDDLFQITAGK